MDPEAFLDLANQVAKLKMYPYFELAHAAVVCLTIKEDMGSGNRYLYLPSKSTSTSFIMNSIILFISIIHFQNSRSPSIFSKTSIILLVFNDVHHICWQHPGQSSPRRAVPNSFQKQQSTSFSH